MREIGFRVKLCTKCDRVWQYYFSGNGVVREFEYLEDFPRYGLKRRNCPKCDVKLGKILSDLYQKRLFTERRIARKKRMSKYE